MDSKVNIGERLKKARLKMNLTQQHLARRAGMSADWICSIERGRRKPELSTISKLTAALGVTLDSIVNNIKPKRKKK